MNSFSDDGALDGLPTTENSPAEDASVKVQNLDETASSCSVFLENIMPDSLEFLSEDSTSVSVAQTLPNVTCAVANTAAKVDDLAFLVSEDSIALGDAHFDPLPHFPDNSTVSPCFSRSRQLVCEDSMESTSRDATSMPIFRDCQHRDENDDFLLTTAEETSMDSGLGSVESAYPNSEEESVGILSPQIPQTSYTLSAEPEQQSPQECGSGTEETCSTSAEVFYDCLPDTESNRILKKRSHDDDLAKEEPGRKKQKTEKRVAFDNVTVFYFPRKQGFVSVPSQGGSTLGMAPQHVECSTMTLHEHNNDIKQRHKEKIHEHMREQKIENKIKQLKFMHPELDNGTLSSMARSTIGQSVSDHRPDDDSILENFDEFFFLQPISAKKRRKILRLSGVDRIDGEEKFINRILRESREMCGCACEQVCIPETCECALLGIQCQVDRESFPCGCAASGCQNLNGRIEFDSERVRTHLLATLEKLHHQEDDASFGAQSKFFTDQAASSESECDFMSSDDAEQSDAEIPVTPERPQFLPTKNPTDKLGNLSAEIDSQIPLEYLDTLGLKKIAIETAETNENLLSTSPVLCSLNRSFQFRHLAPRTLTYGHFSTSSPCRYSTMESLAQSVPDPPTPNRQMFGTTSSYCQGTSAAITRDLSIPLDPIATFMTASYNVSNTETITCSSNG